jgi:hypothetical protein
MTSKYPGILYLKRKFPVETPPREVMQRFSACLHPGEKIDRLMPTPFIIHFLETDYILRINFRGVSEGGYFTRIIEFHQEQDEQKKSISSFNHKIHNHTLHHIGIKPSRREYANVDISWDLNNEVTVSLPSNDVRFKYLPAIIKNAQAISTRIVENE